MTQLFVNLKLMLRQSKTRTAALLESGSISKVQNHQLCVGAWGGTFATEHHLLRANTSWAKMQSIM